MKHLLYGNRNRVINSVRNLQKTFNKQHREAELREKELQREQASRAAAQGGAPQ